MPQVHWVWWDFVHGQKFYDDFFLYITFDTMERKYLFTNFLLWILESFCVTDLSIKPDLIEAEWHINTAVNFAIPDSDNGLSLVQCQAIIWTSTGLLSIWPSGTNFSEIWIKIPRFSIKKCIWKCCLQNGSHFEPATMWLQPMLVWYWSSLGSLCHDYWDFYCTPQKELQITFI